MPPVGPLPGIRDGDAVAYEFELPPSYEPWPGRTRLERAFVLLDLGVQMALPTWRTYGSPGGDIAGIDAQAAGPTTWYVDLVTVTEEAGGIVVRDLYVDVMVPMDGRHPRHLDLEELADAAEQGHVPVAVAMDGLRRWQAFLDRHLHTERDPVPGYADFPPRSIGALAALPAPLGPPVRV